MVTAFVVAWAIFLLHRTQFGRHTYAIGGSMDAAVRSGIPVDRRVIAIYILSAATSGVAGFLSTLRFTAGSAVIGDPLLLSSIAAVIIGGVSMFGGAGTVIGTVIGALIIAVLTTGLVMLNVDAFWQFIVVGTVVIIAVLIDQSRDLIMGRTRGARGAMSEPLLSIRDLTKIFGGLVAVDNVSFDVARGEVVGLLGDNGAGKSTLIKCVSGVHEPEEGEIVFEGKPVQFASPMDARRAGIETIYQDLALANNLDVGANIFLGREVKTRRLGGLIQTLDDKHMREESRHTLDSLQIRFPTLTEPIEKLSGGQRQAVAIARAVYWDARLMIMDEPTNNLGVPEQHKVLELIRTLRDRGVPVILITHILPDAFAVTDRVVVMHRGRKVAEKITARTNTEELVQYMVGARRGCGRVTAAEAEGG